MDKKEMLSKLKREEIYFNLLEDPPTKEMINDRLLSLPNYGVQSEKNENMASNIATLTGWSFFILIGLGGWFGLVQSSNMQTDEKVMATICEFFFFGFVSMILTSVFKHKFIDKDIQNLNDESRCQKHSLSEITEHFYEHMAEMYQQFVKIMD